MKKLCKCLSAILFVASSAAADEIGYMTLDEATALSDEFIKMIADGKYEQGYRSLQPHMPLPGHELDQLVYQTRQQLPAISERFGESIGYEKIKSRKIGKSIIQNTYLQKFDRHALGWVLVLYKPKDKYIVNAVYFTDQIYSWDE